MYEDFCTILNSFSYKYNIIFFFKFVFKYKILKVKQAVQMKTKFVLIVTEYF